MSELILKEIKIEINFPHIHRVLLNTYVESRNRSQYEDNSRLQSILARIRPSLIDCGCYATQTCYERYLRYFAKRFNAPNLYSEYTLFDAAFFEQKLAINPERYDYWLKLALCRLAQGQQSDARHLLQRIAASGFPEAKEAQNQLTALVLNSL